VHILQQARAFLAAKSQAVFQSSYTSTYLRSRLLTIIVAKQH